MFLHRGEIAASPQARLAGAPVAPSALYFCLSQRDPAKMAETLLIQLPCKHSDKVCEGMEGAKALVMVAGGQRWGRRFECSREGMSHTKMPPVSSRIQALDAILL